MIKLNHQVDTFNFSNEKSGGQKEKLAAFIIGASIRFKLSSDMLTYPKFCTVLIDEAFLRSDTEFVRSIMTLNQKMGFQMLVATPGKSIQILEEFLPGATVITIENNKHSHAIPIQVDFNEHQEVVLRAKTGDTLEVEL